MVVQPRSCPFEGLRVLDLSIGIAGAYATKLLADQGADVLMVEPAHEPNPLRQRVACHAKLSEGEDGALYRYLCAGKRSAAIDGDARDALLGLAGEADVVVESGPAARIARLLAPIDELRDRLSHLCVVSISHWGRTGPYAQRPATEWTLQAATGFMARRGRPERGYIGAGGMLGEYAAGSFAAVAALGAWTNARATGNGRHVDVSMFEAMLLCSTNYWDLNAQMCGGTLIRFHDIPSIEPARDGWVGFAPQTSEQWQSFCLMIGHPELYEDPAYLTADKRQASFAELRAKIVGWTAERTVDEILEQCELLRIPSSIVGNGKTILEVDHFKARGVFVGNPHGFVQPRVPFKIAAVEPRPVERAPRLGEHRLEWRPRAARPLRPRGALERISVIDLTAFWAGPFATQMMSALGADIVKIESPSRPDGMRFVNVAPCEPMWEGGPIFHGANTGKRGLTIDLASDRGRALLRRLVERADLLVENFSARVLPNLGLEPETLFAWNPRLVILRMPAWGLDGPWMHRVGFAMNVEQASGIAWRAGYQDQPATANYCDPIGGLHGVVATFAALEWRDATGQGQLIELPLVEPALNMAAEQVIEWSAYGIRLDSEGNRGPGHAPQGIYPCRGTEHIALSVASDDEWRCLCEALEQLAGEATPTLLQDVLLGDAKARRLRHDEIDSALAEVTRRFEASLLVSVLTHAGVSCERLVNGYAVSPHPQLEARGFRRELHHPVTGRNLYPALPIKGLADDWPELPPPTFGQHNREILQGRFGLADDEFEALEVEGVIASKPSWA